MEGWQRCGVAGREAEGQHTPILRDPGLRGPAFPGLPLQLQVITRKFYQVPEGPGLSVWWPAQQHILEVQGLNNLRQRDLGQHKVAMTLVRAK